LSRRPFDQQKMIRILTLRSVVVYVLFAWVECSRG
jgi:hypothetical protein